MTMRTLFIYNYLHICKTTKPFPSSASSLRLGTVPSLARRGSRCHWKLVDPCQLLYNLNHLVHCGFTLHAAAVIDLKLNDNWSYEAPILRQTPPPSATQPHSFTCIYYFTWVDMKWSKKLLKKITQRLVSANFFIYLLLLLFFIWLHLIHVIFFITFCCL